MTQVASEKAARRRSRGERATAVHAGRRRRRSAADSAVTVLPAIDPAARQRMVAEAAYYLAERRSFRGGRDLDDWLLAEAQIEELVGMGNLADQSTLAL